MGLLVMNESVSVVVAAYNEERHIVRLLDSLADQTLSPCEVIVVDDGSSDGTAALAVACGAQVFSTLHRGPAHARNHGARHAVGAILVFVDGDMVCSRDYVAALARPIAAGAAVGTFTKEIYVGQPANGWSRSYCHVRRLAYPRLLRPDFPNRWSNFRAVRRDAFLSVGGYDDVGYGEDMTLAPKLGTLAEAAQGAICWHFNPDSPREIFDNARWIGRGHDAQQVAHPVRDNLPVTTLIKAARDLAAGAPPQIIPARFLYSCGFLLGLLDRRWRSAGHAK
jgi:glycosyltransferase involved in cell wall biosynthesis